jgi:hypothetical protein
MAGLWDNYKKYSGLDFLFGNGENPADEASPYLDQIPGETRKNLQPWADYGMSLTQNPGGRLNQIGQDYKQSPGFQFALQQALQGGNHAAAAGGMAGSPQHEFQNMATATGLASQDYNDWMKNALGLHNEGYQQGQTASTNINDQIIQALAAKSGLAYKGAAQQNQGFASNLGNVLQGAGSLAAFL